VALSLFAPAPGLSAPLNLENGAGIDAGRIESGETLIERPLDEDGVAGIVADQTMTQTGKRFAEGFTSVWRGLGNTAEHNVAIYERPSARWGSLIWIDQDFRRVYKVFIYPGRMNPRAFGENAAIWVQRRIADIEAEKALFTDPDIAKDADM
jgi:curli production assembly/transport component CsgE